MKTKPIFPSLAILAVSFALVSLRASVHAAGTITLTTLGLAYSQDFDTLANTGTSSTVPEGWDFAESGTNANTEYTASTGSSTAGDTYSFGAAGNSERAFGGLQSGSLIPTLGAQFTNDTGAAITSLAISYTGEQWRLGALSREDRLDFQLSTDATSLTTGTWTDYNALDFIAPTTGPATGALDGNAGANRTTLTFTITGLNIGSGGTFWIRWTDFNASGSDDGLSVDDFSLTPLGGEEDLAPYVAATTPENGATNVAVQANISLTFSEAVDVSGTWFDITCTTSGLHTAGVSGGPVAFTLNPDTDFASAESCTVTIFAAQVTDQDTDDPPDNMESDHSFGFSTTGGGAPALVINEVDYDQPGTDNAEFIELRNNEGTSVNLDGFTLELVNGDGGGAVIYQTISLPAVTLPAGEYFVVCGDAANVPNCDLDVSPNTNLIQNGAPDAVGLRFNGTLVDAVSYEGDTGAPYTEGSGVGLVDTAIAAESIARCPDGVDTQQNNVDFQLLAITPGAVNCAMDLSVQKDGPAITTPGSSIQYTLQFANVGNALAGNVVVTDTLPVGVSYQVDTSGLPCPACTIGATGVLTWEVGTLPEGGSASFILTGLASNTLPFGSILTNTVAIAAPGVDANPGDNEDSAVTSISELDLGVSKTGQAIGFTGDELLYSIQVEVQGIAPAANVIVTDTLPAGLTAVNTTSNAITVTQIANQVIFAYGNLNAGATEWISVTVSVDNTVPDNTILINHVKATTTTPGDDPANNTATWNTTIYQPVPIATARAGSDGDVFTVEGQVIYTPGTFNASGWALQDASGGIGVFYTPPPAVNRHDVVRLRATRGSFNGEEQFTAPVSFFANLGPGAPVAPISYTTGQVNAGNSEGWLVMIEGTLSNLTACSGNYSFQVNDGSGPATVFVDLDTGINVCALGAQNGDTIRVTGFSTQFNTTYEVKPRDLNDIQLFLPIPVLGKSAPLVVAPGELFTYTLTLQNFVGYTLTGVVITDVIPANSTFAFAQDGGTETSGIVTWTIGDLPDQSVVSVRFAVTATINAPAVIRNETYAMTATNSPTPIFGTPVSTLVMGAIGPNCGDPAIYIHDIQGSGSASPFVGIALAVEGVVVGDYQTGGIIGFFVQEEDADADANPMTSEGLFIFNTSFAVTAGDVVRVFGTVAEFNGLTELNQVTNVVVCGQGTVTPASVTLPVADLSEWEWYEGMLLNIPHPLYVTELFRLGRFGEISLSVNDRLEQPTQVTDPGAAALALQDLNNRSRIQLNDGQTGQNPDPIIYPSPELSATNTLRGGDWLADLTGVLNYRFGAYLLEPVGPISFTHGNPRPPQPDPLDGALSVASFNLLNYFSTIDTGQPICGPAGNQECRGADSALEFTRQRDKIINALLAMDAGIVVLVEIENHPDDEALDDLVSGLNAAAGAGTYAAISTGSIGTDAIKVALIYQPAKVIPFGPYAILDDAFDPAYQADYNRPALAQTFQELATGSVFTVVVNHLKSKGSSCAAIGDLDTGDGQGNCNLTRLAAVEVLMDWIATNPTGRIDADYLLLGDFNAYAREDPITALGEGGFINLHTLAGENSYSYAFDGQWGTLDYALANAAMRAQVNDVTVWHINADELVVLDYNVEFKSAHHLISLYSPAPFRASDHDPIVIGLNLTPLQASFLSNSPVVLGNTSVFTGTANQNYVTYAWDFGDGGTSMEANPVHVYGAVGTYMVTLEVSNGFASVIVTRPHVVLPAPPPEETALYLPIVIRSGTTQWVKRLVSDRFVRSPQTISICEIQDDGKTTPYQGEEVLTEGVVTADFDHQSKRGFFMQKENCDGNPATSDGLFVYLNEMVNVVNVGDWVVVSGMAEEDFGLTRINTTQAGVTVISSGNALPQPVDFAPPFNNQEADSYFEAREGMRVQAADTVVVGPTNARGYTFVVRAGLGIVRIFHDDPAGTGAIIPISSDGVYQLEPQAQVGDQIFNVVGVLNFTGGDFGILLTSFPTLIRPSAAFSEPDDLHWHGPWLPARQMEGLPFPFSIATVNLHNLFDTVNDPETEDSVLTASEYQRKLKKLALTIHDVLGEPWLIAVQEAENNAVLQALVNRPEIQANYAYVWANSADVRGIDVALLYQTEHVTVLSW